MKKTEEQIERKRIKVTKRMRFLNNPDLYGNRELTNKETRDLYEVIGQWEILSWLTGKYR
jgi:hypothetical protein